MKTALTIRQPWVSAILYHGKDVECRTWDTSYRGTIYLHAAATPHPYQDALERLTHAFDATAARAIMSDARTDVRGAIVGTVRLTDVRRDSVSPWSVGGMLSWVLTHPRPFTHPVPMRGRLGLWSF